MILGADYAELDKLNPHNPGLSLFQVGYWIIVL